MNGWETANEAENPVRWVHGEVGRWFGVAGAADGLSPAGFPLGACVPSHLGVSLPSGPLSNRACGSPAHGFPTPFIVRHAHSPISGRFL